MNALRLPVRLILTKGIRNFASASPATGGHDHHVEHKKHKEFKIPVATMDDVPVPKYPYKEMYNKENAKFNLMLLAAMVAFGLTVAYMVVDDTLYIEASSPPLSYRNRKVYKETDP